jgi:hypothetical protein
LLISKRRKILGARSSSELADVLDDLGTPDIVTLDQVAKRAEAVHTPLAVWLRDRGNHRSIPHRFEDCDYVAVANPSNKDGRWKIKGERFTVYGRASLTERDRIAAAQKFTTEYKTAASTWEHDDDDRYR